MKKKLLIVDDEAANLRMLERLFREDYEVVTAISGAAGLVILTRYDVAVIVSDQRMPVMTGIEFLKRAALLRPHTVRIILTGYTDVSDLVDAINSRLIYKYITKPWINTDLRQNVAQAMEYHEVTRHQHLLAQTNKRLEIGIRSSLKALVNLIHESISLKRPDLAEHCHRTAIYAELIGKRLHLSPAELEALAFAAMIHEFPHLRRPIGIDFDREILSHEQFEQLRNSYDAALNLIADVLGMEDVITAIRYQHERYDGGGFFDKFSGETIPLNARILSVANAIDEIQSGRRPEFYCTDEETLEFLRERSGSALDPEIVETCLKMDLVKTQADPTFVRPVQFRNSIGAGL